MAQWQFGIGEQVLPYRAFRETFRKMLASFFLPVLRSNKS